jgi:alpha-beta hydrolase superfamily lysophospholipase
VAYHDSKLSTPDGIELYLARWEPDGDARAVVFLIHGIGEHIGRYADVAAQLNKAGFACCGIDLRGHGRSDGPRGHAPSLERILDDISLMLDSFQEIKPAFLYGHSLGATLALEFGRVRPEGLSGVIATGPWLKLRFEPPRYKVMLARIVPRFVPKMSLSSGLDVQALSRDSSIVDAYIHDPLVHDRITAQLGAIMLNLADDLLANPQSFRLPLLMMHGEDDRLTDPNASRAFFDGVGSTDKTFRLWPGLFHEIHNEPEQAEVIAQIVSWLEAHVDPSIDR